MKMLETIDGFDWNEWNWPKCGKHGVSREEIEAMLLSNPLFYSMLRFKLSLNCEALCRPFA